MPTLESPANPSPAVAPAQNTLRGSFGVYRDHFVACAAAFLLPAVARLAWTLLQRAITYHRHPEWPQAGILINASGGLNIYWSTVALTWVGLFVYLVFSGPALSAISRMVMPSSNRPRNPAAFLGLQLLATIRAWSVFAAGLFSAVFVASTFLIASPDRALLVWYLLIAITFLAGLPLGIFLTLRYAFAIPAASHEGIRLGAAIERSAQFTRGIKSRLLLHLGAILGVRWLLGIGAAWLIALLLPVHRESAFPAAYILVPVVLCLLDTLFGPLWASAIAVQYRGRAAEEMRSLAPQSPS